MIPLIRPLALTLFLAAVSLSSSFASSEYWGGGTGSTSSGTPAGGNWDNTTTDWSTTSGGTANAIWSTTTANQTAVFGGKDGTYGVNVNAALTKPPQYMQFLFNGYTLTSSVPQTISFSGTGAGATPNIQIASGKVAAIGTNVTVASTVTCLWGNDAGTAGGELDILNGGTLSLPGGSTLGIVGIGTLTSVKTGGQITVASGSTSSTFIFGDLAGDNSTLSVDGGTVSIANSQQLQVGGKTSGVASAGTLTVNSGSFSMAAANTTYPMTLGPLSGNLGTNNLNGGVESVNQIVNGTGSGYINFNGGVLKAVNNAFASTFLNGLTAAYVKSGGAVVDNNGFAITIGQALLTAGGTDGGLIATNSGSVGSLTVSGANTYNGPTIVKTGANLITTTASTGAGSYSVSNNATLQVQVSSSGGHLAMSSLTLGTSGSDSPTNVFTLGANASTTTAAVAVSGALVLNGTVTVNATGSGLTGPNTYLLLSYGSSSGAGSFVSGSLPVVAGYVGYVTNNPGAKQLQLVYVLAPQAVKWAVGNGNWDTSTTNWYAVSGVGGLTNYVEGAPVLFDDTASGSSPITVTLTGNHSPSAITNNNSAKNYTLSGSGNILGSSLLQSGSGTVILDNGSVNTFSGITISNGTVQLGNNDTGGSFGSAGITNYATLALNRTDNPTLANVISGSGNVTQNGSGAATLTGANMYTGNTLINAGQLITTTASTGAGAFSVADGATLGVQVAAAGHSLTNSSLSLGTSGNLTNVFTLGANGSTTVPVIQDNGALVLNGTVAVNVSGSGLASGTYPLISYGSLSGSGSFVLVSAPSVAANVVTLTNNPTTKQLSLVYTAATSLIWDSGNTANGATIDAASGTWDMNLGNPVWNDNGVNVAWANSIAATFGGADGSWAISLATNVSPTTLTFSNSGYAISAAAPQSITLATGTGAAPNFKVNTGKTVVIGNNVTVQTTGANNLIVGGPSGTGYSAGTLEIDNGGIVQMAGTSTLGLVGAGAVINVMTGGVLGRTATGTFLLGSTTGDNCALNVNGGSVAFTGSGAVHIGGNGTAASLGGTLNVNSGSFSMDAANTTVPMTLGVLAGNLGTNNLNGGVLSVNQIVQGAGNGFINFNGGTLKAVNGAFASTFMNGLTAAAVQGGGAVINNNGFAITIGQPLLNGGGLDGGLTALGAGSLTLTGVSTYNGNTVISNSTLVLTGSALIANSASVELTGASAKLDVSTVAGGFALAGGQTLSGVGVVTGAVTMASSATLYPGKNGVGTLSFSNNLVLNGASTNSFVVTTAGGASNSVAVAGLLTPNSSVVSVTSGTPLIPGTYTLFTYGTVSGAFNPLPVFDVAPVHTNYAIVDSGAGQIELIISNRPPVAQNFALGVTPGIPSTIQVIGGKYAPIDPDGDALTITSVSAAANGTVTTDGLNITYTLTDAASTDSFTYTISDGYGGTAVGTVSVVSTSVQGYNQLGVQTVGGNIVLSYLGIPGYQYALDWTPSLTQPITWTPVMTNTAAANGFLNFTNSTVSDGSAFYRTRYVP